MSTFGTSQENTYRLLLESIRNVQLNKPENNEEGMRNVCVCTYENDEEELCANCYAYEAPCGNCRNEKGFHKSVIGFKNVSYSDVFLGFDKDGCRTYPDVPYTYRDFYYSNPDVREYKWEKEVETLLPRF